MTSPRPLLLALLVACHGDPSPVGGAPRDPGGPDASGPRAPSPGGSADTGLDAGGPGLDPTLGRPDDPAWQQVLQDVAAGETLARDLEARVEAARAQAPRVCPEGVAAWRGGRWWPTVQRAVRPRSPHEVGEVVLLCPGVHREAVITPWKQVRVLAPLVAGSRVVLDGDGVRTPLTTGFRTSVGLVDLVVQGGAGDEGGGARVLGDRFVAVRVRFEAHRARRGGGLFVQDAAETVLLDCAFQDNAATEDGGGAWIASEAALVGGSAFDDNRAGGAGGGLRLLQDTWDAVDARQVVVVSSRFRGNVGGDGAGLALGTRHAPLRASLAGNALLANRAARGGGWHAEASAGGVRSWGDRLVDGEAGRGAGLHATSEGALEVRLDRVELTGHRADVGGALAVNLPQGALWLEDVHLEDNTAAESAGLDFRGRRAELIRVVALHHGGDGSVLRFAGLPGEPLETARVSYGRVASNRTAGPAVHVTPTLRLLGTKVDFGTGRARNPGGDLSACGFLGRAASFRVTPGRRPACD